jgi:hypothetical protein
MNRLLKYISPVRVEVCVVQNNHTNYPVNKDSLATIKIKN